MGLFGPPDIEKLKTKRDVRGLIGALRYRAAPAVRKNAALALAELAAGGTQPAQAFEPAVGPLIAALEDSDGGVVNASIQALASIGRPALLPLISAVRSPGDHTREASARAIGRIAPTLPDPAHLKLAVDPLVGLLRDPAVAPRRSSAWALGRLSPYLEPSQRVLLIEGLILALRDPAAEVRETVAAVLGRTGEGRAIRPLVSALGDESIAVRKIASEGLNALGWQPADASEVVQYNIARQKWEDAAHGGSSAAEPLIRIMAGGDRAARLAAIKALGQTRAPEAISPLLAALKDPDDALRAAAASALEQVVDQQQNGADQAVDALLQAARDRDRDVRKAVALALARTGDERALPPLLTMLRSHEQDMVRVASNALITFGGLASPHMIRILDEADGELRKAAAEILTQIGSTAVNDLTALLREGRPPLNKLAADILGNIRDPRAVWPLVSALQFADMAVPAAQALGKIGDPRAVKPLLEMLNGSFSETVQQATALALGSIGDPQALDALIQLLRASDRNIRSDAAIALIQMYRSGKLDLTQKRKIFDQHDRIIQKHTDMNTHQDETRGSDWHIDQTYHEDTGIGLDFPTYR
jgi:HEAT repeat protein